MIFSGSAAGRPARSGRRDSSIANETAGRLTSGEGRDIPPLMPLWMGGEGCLPHRWNGGGHSVAGQAAREGRGTGAVSANEATGWLQNMSTLRTYPRGLSRRIFVADKAMGGEEQGLPLWKRSRGGRGGHRLRGRGRVGPPWGNHCRGCGYASGCGRRCCALTAGVIGPPPQTRPRNSPMDVAARRLSGETSQRA